MSFPQPELLTHPNIPDPMQGLNPRTVKGESWWNETRQLAYAQFDYRCWACATHKDTAIFLHRLEAHESYEIDYEIGVVRLKEVVALCHACHNFIHSGRLWALYSKGEISRDKIMFVLGHGINICKTNGLQPFFAAYLFKSMLHGNTREEALDFAKQQGGWFPPNVTVPWEKWRMIIDDKAYASKFENAEASREYYSNLDMS
jgi:hypothetical protein